MVLNVLVVLQVAHKNAQVDVKQNVELLVREDVIALAKKDVELTAQVVVKQLV